MAGTASAQPLAALALPALPTHTPSEQEAAMVPCEAAVQVRATPCPSPRLGLLPADTAAACTQQHPSGVPLCFMQQEHCAAISV